MSASPHSLTFSFPAPASRRSSLNQLPLPSTLTAAAPPPRRAQGHAPGITPSASFFRPSKPRPPSSPAEPEHSLKTLKEDSHLSSDDDHDTYAARKSPSHLSSRSASPVASFVASPSKDLSHVPRQPPISRWRHHPSRNRFFFNGRIMTGGDAPYAFMAAMTLLLSVAAVYSATTAQWWWHHEGAGGKVLVIITGYLALVAFSNMLVTAFTDPGILPRNLDPEPPYHEVEGSDPAPMPRILKVRSDV